MGKRKGEINGINAKIVGVPKSSNSMKNIARRVRNWWRKPTWSVIAHDQWVASLASAIEPSSTGLKKAQSLPDLKTTMAPAQPAADPLEADELFTFVQCKLQHQRVWIVQCRRTRQVLSFFVGDGSMESCRRLWRKLPYEYLRCESFSDKWRAYHCIPSATHQLVGKETGETAHIERLNNTLRQRVSRLVRKTLSFSKQKYMLNLHLKLFFYHYNLERLST
jgi:insertion element IS1 protein InsB